MSFKNIIPATDYIVMTALWREQQSVSGTYSFFTKDGQRQTGMIFDFDNLKFLFSTTGVATVKIRFGLRLVDGELEFALILFGVDKDNITITPYFTSDLYTYLDGTPPISGPQGDLPKSLMEFWESSWLTNESVTSELFDTRYGFLQGYNYPIQDLMNAMCGFEGASNICVAYGLHPYYPLVDTPKQKVEVINTFGVILYASAKVTAETADATTLKVKQTSAGAYGAVEDSGYYDLTAPCPHTC